MKILCIQLRQMGDVMMTTPAVRQLRALYPDAEIVFMTEPLGANVYRDSPYVSRVWIVPRKQSALEFLKLLWRVRQERFELAIDFFSNPKSAQITWASRAKKRIGFDFRGRRLAYTHPVSIPKTILYAAQAKNCLIEPLGGRIDDDRIEFFEDPALAPYADSFCAKHGFEGRTIASCVVSRREYKLLPPEFFAAVGNALIAAGYKLFFVYGPGERAMADAVFSKLERSSEAIIDYEMPDIRQLRSLLGRCLLYAGNDGGSKHLSVCAGIPSVTVFSRVRAKNWTPEGHIAFQIEDGVSADAVIDACLKQLKEST